MDDIYWYAASNCIAWMGPYASQIEAWDATIGLDGLPVQGARVWCTRKRLEVKRG